MVTVALLLQIMDWVGSLDSSRDLQPIYAKNFVNRLHLVHHACVEIFDVMVFCVYGVYGVRSKQGLNKLRSTQHAGTMPWWCRKQIMALNDLFPINSVGARHITWNTSSSFLSFWNKNTSSSSALKMGGLCSLNILFLLLICDTSGFGNRDRWRSFVDSSVVVVSMYARLFCFVISLPS